MNRPDQLRSHLARARDNGVTEEEIVESITHLAFYAGWPSAVTAVTVAKEVFGKKSEEPAVQRFSRERRVHMRSERVSMLCRSAIARRSSRLRASSARPASVAAQALKDLQTPDTPLVLKAQGSFFVGGEKAEQTQVELGGLGPGGPHHRQPDVRAVHGAAGR